jgi:hypothetical protein
MATETVPTTVTPEAAALAKEYGVERELEAILEKGRETVRGLRALEVDADNQSEMGRTINVRAWVDPATEDDPSHHDWWCWRIDQYGPRVAALFIVAIYPDRATDGR